MEKYNKRAIGAFYEKKAGAFLEEKGFRILEYNFRCKSGEIDIIAKDGSCFVFCEVKYRKSDRFGHALESVGRKKQMVISKCALYYLLSHGLGGVECRFDVVGIEKDKIIHIKNAFQL